MAQISYTNKVALNENPDIADINKVTDDDMNEIKSVVNANYNNTIQITDTEPTDSDNKIWIDTGEVGSQASEITNTYNTSENLGYSCNYVNNRTNIFDLIRFENITAEGSYTLAAGGAVYKGTTCPTIEGYKPWFCYEVIGQGNAGIRGYTSIPNANNEVGCWVANVTTSSITVTGTQFRVMYIKEAS